ncbi:hypothetical protein [Flavobacterium sp. LAR06]
MNAIEFSQQKELMEVIKTMLRNLLFIVSAKMKLKMIRLNL